MTHCQYEYLYKKALDKWGPDIQLLMAMEEAGELVSAISHYIRFGSDEAMNELIDGIADMEVMIAQIKFMFNAEGIEDKIDEVVDRKMDRLEELLEEVQNGNKHCNDDSAE